MQSIVRVALFVHEGLTLLLQGGGKSTYSRYYAADSDESRKLRQRTRHAHPAIAPRVWLNVPDIRDFSDDQF